MEFITCDSFLTTTINYLNFKDLYLLSQVDKYCYQLVNPKNRLLDMIHKEMKKLFGENYRKVQDLFTQLNILITGKFIGKIFSEKYTISFFSSHIYVLSNDPDISQIYNMYPTLRKRLNGLNPFSILRHYVSNDPCINFAIHHDTFKENPKYLEQESCVIYDDNVVFIDYQKLFQRIEFFN